MNEEILNLLDQRISQIAHAVLHDLIERHRVNLDCADDKSIKLRDQERLCGRMYQSRHREPSALRPASHVCYALSRAWRSPLVISALLGHATPIAGFGYVSRMTPGYAHATWEAMVGAVMMLDEPIAPLETADNQPEPQTEHFRKAG
jgi:hypothetical protein